MWRVWRGERGRRCRRRRCLSVGSDQEAGVAREEEAEVGTEQDGGVWRGHVLLETERLIEYAIS